MVQKGNILNIITAVISLLLPCTAAQGQPSSSLPAAGRDARFTVLEREDRGTYDCLLIDYGLRSYLLLPDGADSLTRCPGIVMLHDHGARFDIGKEKLARPLESAPEHVKLSSRQWVDEHFDGVYFADSLASLGYAVIIPDMLYWGDRSSDACRQWSRLKFNPGRKTGKPVLDSLKHLVYEGQKAVYDSLMSEGIVWAEMTMKEDALAAEIISGMDCVDSSRVAAVGWSMGAHRAWLLTAFCPEVKAGVSLCWMTLKETQPVPPKASDYAMLIPELREKYDFPDIAAKLAPKPYLFLNGTRDHLFPVPPVSEAFGRMQSIYRDLGAEGRLETVFFDGGHHCGKEVQSMIVEFLEKTVPLPYWK